MDMPENQTTEAESSTETPAPEAAPKVQTQGQPASTNGKSIMLTSGALKKRVDEAKERGRRQAQAEQLAKAKDMGFDSADEMFQAFAEMNSKPKQETREASVNKKNENRPQQQQPQQSKGNGGSDRRDFERLQRENQKLAKERDDLARRARHEEKQRRELRRQLEVKEAERVLAIMAAKHGIRDPKNIDYAIHLLRQETQGKDDDYLGKFDEEAFFKGLGEQYPHLRNEVIKPATTGHATDAQPTPPKVVAGEAAQNGQVDVRKLGREAFEKLLQERRLNNVVS